MHRIGRRLVIALTLITAVATFGPSAQAAKKPKPPAGNGPSGTLVVLNKAEATASLIDLASGQVMATVPTGAGPHEAAVSPDGHLAVAANYGDQTAGSSLTVIDVGGGRALRTIKLDPHRRPHGIAWFPDGRRLAVTSEASRALLIVDAIAGSVEAAIDTDQDVSHMVALARDGKRAYVANIGSGSVTALDLENRKRLGVVPTGAGAEGIALSPDGSTLWVTNRDADTVSVVDTSSLEVAATLPSASFPIRAASTPDGKTVLVSNAKSGELAIFDAATRAERKRIKLALDPASKEGRLFDMGDSPVPIGIVVHPSGRTAFVANANADVIAVVDLDAGRVTGTLKAGKEPDGMAHSTVRVNP